MSNQVAASAGAIEVGDAAHAATATRPAGPEDVIHQVTMSRLLGPKRGPKKTGRGTETWTEMICPRTELWTEIIGPGTEMWTEIGLV